MQTTPDRNMKASELKTITMGEFIYGKGYMGLFTEGLGNGDVVGIRNSGYIVEFEIKVDKQDLRNEIKAIQCAIANDMRGCYSNSKFYKHEKYLGFRKDRYTYDWVGYKPNLFYFVVPIEFESIAVDGVKGTPYGVYCHGDWEYTLHFSSGDQQRIGRGFKESVKAKPIHKEKITYIQMQSIVRKATTELYETRKRLLK
jgi:hypothetical protein